LRLSSTSANVRLLSIPALSAPRLGAVLLYLALFSIGLTGFTDPDYGWHLQTGKIIVQSASIPRHDSFTFTSGDHVWVTHEWLSEVIMYAVQSLGGYAANALLFTAAAVGTLAVGHRAALSLGVSRWTALFLVAWAGFLSVPYGQSAPRSSVGYCSPSS
jgi:hypothetical protein